MLTLRSAATRGLIALPLLAGAVAAQPALAAHHPAMMHKTITVKEAPGTGANKNHYYFQPAKVTIKVGDTIKWIDTTSMVHNVIGYKSALSTKAINFPAPGIQSHSVTFKTAGTYNYECTLHLPTMVGQIVVTK